MWYDKKSGEGDFTKMIQDPQYENVIFIFNSNFEDRHLRRPGGGSAAIRPYSFPNHMGCVFPRSVGVHTGWSIQTGGFQYLDQDVKMAIRIGFERLNYLLHKNPAICTVIYPAAKGSDSIGTGIFTVGKDVVDEINRRLSIIQEVFENDDVFSYRVLSLQEQKLEERMNTEKLRSMHAMWESKKRNSLSALDHTCGQYAV